MNVLDFFDTIDEHPHLYGLGVKNNPEDKEPHLFVECVQANNLITELSYTAIENTEWDVLQDILMGTREPEALYTIARVCGYFSRVTNWSSSKVSELKDRQKGNYTV